MSNGSPRVGLFPPFGLLERDRETARSFLAGAAEAGLDHVCCADHVSFVGGLGFDGLVQATALALLHPSLPVYTGLYLLPLRHPVLVARQLADLGQLAPGRLIFGVGVGGEDRHEVQICGVDPASRGRRMNESLQILRELAASEAELAGRPAPSRHGMQVWCGIAGSREDARACLAPAMEAFYGLPFDRFERYCPYGTAADVAEFLAPYVAAGCGEFNLIPQSPDHDQAIAGTAAVKRQLGRM